MILRISRAADIILISIEIQGNNCIALSELTTCQHKEYMPKLL